MAAETPQVRLIGVSGRMGAGKDTFAASLIGALLDQGFEARGFSFAAPLKQHAKGYFGWDGVKSKCDRARQYLDNEVKYVDLIGGRRLLQGLGLFAREQFSPNFWIDKLKEEIVAWIDSSSAQKTHFAVVSDVRFPNEAQMSDFLIRVERQGLPLAAHVSESAGESPEFLACVRATVENNGTPDELFDKAAALAKSLIAEFGAK